MKPLRPYRRKFAAAPLITAERLNHCRCREELEAVFSPAPHWASYVSSGSPDEFTPDEALMVFRAGRTHEREYGLPPSSLAVIFELTRYGNSVATTTNKRSSAAHRSIYPRMTFSEKGQGVQLGRIVLGVGLRQSVSTPEASHGSFTNMHPDELTLEGAGKPERDARATAIRHAERCAREYAPSEADANAYLANLNALFAFHDEVFHLQPL